MSSISSVGSSSQASYGTQLAQSSKLARSLSSLDSAIQTGNLTSASDVIASLVKDYPQYAVSSTSGSSSSDPINQGFQTLSTDITNGNVDDARNAWTQLKKDLADSGVALSDGNSSLQKIIAQSKESIDEAIISSLGLGNSGSSSSVSDLLGGGSSETPDALSSLVSNWVTYKTTGATTQIPTASTAASTTDASSSTSATAASAASASSSQAAGTTASAGSLTTKNLTTLDVSA